MLSVSCFVYLFILLAVTGDFVGTETLKPPASDFKNHRIVQPIVHHARTKREISTTRDANGAHHSEVTITVPIDGEEYILDLQLNLDLITDNHVLSYQENGKTVVQKPKKEEIDLCHYGGSVRNKPGSWVALSTCHGLQGVVFDGQRMRYIEPALGGEITSDHYVYDHGDLSQTYHCGNEDGVTNSSHHELHNEHQHHRQKRYIPYDRQVHEPYNANKLSRYVELVLVADTKMYQSYGRDLHIVYRQIKTIANMINSVYAPINIFIALVGVVVWTDYDEIQVVDEADKTLFKFLEYRKTELVKNIPNDNAQLLTGQKMINQIVGKGFTGDMCSFDKSVGIASKTTEVIGLLAHTISHEMGHNLGMGHDSDECDCPDQKCIMYPQTTSAMLTHWSSCSLNNLAYSFSNGMDYCLRNKPKSLFRSATCGNGFVEPGEQCDCGTMSVAGAYNPCHSCCEPSTCMLRANATCGAGKCCDLQTCRPMSAGTMCRGAERECDLPEYCTGHSEFCPDDVFKMDSTPCGKDGHSAYCMRGGCHSHSDQCRLLWGITGKTGHNNCYRHNEKGDDVSNCGYDHSFKRFKQCSPQDVMCGRLYCSHLDIPKLDFGSWTSQVILTLQLNLGDTTVKCSAVTFGKGLEDVDMGLVPDGAKCGDGLMCMNQRCVSVAAVRETIVHDKLSPTPDCSGHGVFNSKGHCHCEAGFAPPLCAQPGLGGSDDSGPATNPSIQRNFMVSMYVIFLGIIPSIVVILLLIYSFCPAILQCQKSHQKVPSSDKDPSKPNNVIRESNTPIYANIEFKKSERLPNFILALFNGNVKNNSVNIENITKADSIHLLHKVPNIDNIPYNNENIRTNKFNSEPSSPLYANNEHIKKYIIDNTNEPTNGNSAKNPESFVNNSSYTNLPNTNVKCSTNLLKAPETIINIHNTDLHNASNNVNNNMSNTKLQNIPENISNISNVQLPSTVVNNKNAHNNNLRLKPENVINLSHKELSKGSGNIVLTNVKLRKTPGNIVNSSNKNIPNTTYNSNNILLKETQGVHESDNINLSHGNLQKVHNAKSTTRNTTSVDNINVSSKTKLNTSNVKLSNRNVQKTSDNVVDLSNVKLRKTTGTVSKDY